LGFLLELNIEAKLFIIILLQNDCSQSMRSLVFPYKVLVLSRHCSLMKTKRWVPYLQIHVRRWRKNLCIK